MDAMRRGLGLDVIEVKREELLSKLEANRTEHMKQYESAMVGFKGEAIAKLQELLHDAVEVGHVPEHVSFDKPRHYFEDYTTVIEMLEMSVDQTLSITRDQFMCYVQDKWGWKRGFLDNVTKYAAGRG